MIFTPYCKQEYNYHPVDDVEWWDGYFKWCNDNLKD